MKKKIEFCLAGISGKMGLEVLKTLPQWPDITLKAATGKHSAGKKVSSLLTSSLSSSSAHEDMVIEEDLEACLKKTPVDVFLDFTYPDVAFQHAVVALNHRVPTIVGTSGLQDANLTILSQLCEKNNVPCLIVPNFSLGAILGIHFAELAAPWISDVEITELHHPFKHDAPSGTAFELARRIQKSRVKPPTVLPSKQIKLEGVRGGNFQAVPIHSIRLPGILAQQSALFGSEGETLEIRHSVISRSAYMQGIELALVNIQKLKGLNIGLEVLLGLSPRSQSSS